MSKKNDKADMWMPLYIGDYIADTMRLTRAQHGSYILILMAMWREGGWIDVADLAVAGRMSEDEWAAEGPKLARYLIIENGRATQKRLLEELTSARKISANRKVSGKLGADARWSQTDSKPDGEQDGRTITGAVANASQINTPSPSPSPLQSPSPPPAQKSEGARSQKPDFQMTGFGDFWAHYPRRIKRPAAEEAWSLLAPDADLRVTIMASLEDWKQSHQWSDKNFIPAPEKWLKQRQWEDDVPRETAPAAQQDQAAAAWLAQQSPQTDALKPPNGHALPDDFIVDYLNNWGAKLGVTQGADESETEFYAAVVQAVETESQTGNAEATQWLEQYGEQARAMVPA